MLRITSQLWPLFACLFLLIVTLLFTTTLTEADQPGTSFTMTIDVGPSGGDNVRLDQAIPSVYPVTFTFNDGEAVRLETISAFGYNIKYWSGDLAGTTNSTTIMRDVTR
ncbi:hypothetical protein ACFLTP_09770 [Chloroflexota bacterium]